MAVKIDKLAHEVMVKAQLAAALEVSAYPKPGNVHRLRDRWGKRFEHFLAGSIAIGPVVRESVIKGFKAWLKGDLSLIGIGRLIEKAVRMQLQAHSAGNTHLGVIMLFIPIAASIPIWHAESEEIWGLRNALLRVLKATTIDDANALMRSIRLAKPSGMGRPPKGLPDVLKRQKVDVNMYQLLEASSKWDGVAMELTSGLEMSLNVGLPTLIEVYEKFKDVNMAIVHCFLKLLSEKPDTLIARSVGLSISPHAPIDKAVRLGMREALRVSERAREALRMGGLATSIGRRLIEDLDRELEYKGPSYNPGTTADITAASIFLALLSGFKML